MKIREECGIFGAIGNQENLIPIIFEGLFALQHRGQEAAGLVAVGRNGFFYYRGLGLISDVFDRARKEKGEFEAFCGIAHTRYSTHGAKVLLDNVQPFVTLHRGQPVAIAHNGNISNAIELREKLEDEGALFHTDSDTEILLHLYVRRGGYSRGGKNPFFDAKGAYSLLILDRDTLIAVRDERGFRPLVMGRIGETLCFASETAAIDAVGADFVREVEPGEVVVVRRGEPERSFRFKKSPSFCVFELIYFARPDSTVFGESVYSFRKRTGEKLAEKEFKRIDVVVPIPDSGLAASLGYARRLGVPLELGLMRSHYVGRSFIQPDLNSRTSSVRRKLLPLREVLQGKSVALVDDSIVRGTTARSIVRLVKEFGAKEVHYRVASPPLVRPCFFGIDMPTVEEFVASDKTLSDIEKFLGVDSLVYLTIDELKNVLEKRSRFFCYACFNGEYPEGSLPELLLKKVQKWPPAPILKEKGPLLSLFQEDGE